jgi:MYXO-CTERM domain-containing protein
MRSLGNLLLGLAVLAIAATHAREASASGGCFVPETADMQVTSHRMILSISPWKTTLWDQIAYSGDPASFGWVLPIKGAVDVGVSTDAMFAVLDAGTPVQVFPPSLDCPKRPTCGEDLAGGGDEVDGTDHTDSGDWPPVEVIEQKVVGPYEIVRLESDDPQALSTWLADNGYTIPAEVAPVIAAYVAEQFDFLAIKLVPGQGVEAMRPVRVTSEGASPTLPLRMLAAGAGAVTPITLWVVAEAAYEPTNFATFLIAGEEITWNWDTQSSDFADVRAQRFAAADGAAWHIETSDRFSPWSVEVGFASVDGYWDANSGADLYADLYALQGAIDTNSLWVTRLYGELSRSALSTDLELAVSNRPVPPYVTATKSIGAPPACPSFSQCDDGCAMATGSSGAASRVAALGVVAAVALIAARRRRRG